MLRLYGADPAILKSLAGTNISVIIGAANGDIPNLANSPSFASQWVAANVAPFVPATKISPSPPPSPLIVGVGSILWAQNPYNSLQGGEGVVAAVAEEVGLTCAKTVAGDKEFFLWESSTAYLSAARLNVRFLLPIWRRLDSLRARVLGHGVRIPIAKVKGMHDGGAEGNRSKKVKSEDTCDHSDKGEEDVEEEEARKNRLGLNKKSGDDDELIAKGKSYVNSCK
ncbi:uncharacterized protein A4U43_C03F26940 [Asparagus officinalis]|uniref:Glucan endo-1,3-beta-D-glucosidase n=1 Tax=Asparagus officinalis TaxID=4686 RepID=A0A5P1FD81_ASPOF|nr:uncharacterized protein A4U43_C03F26940 [Asparagus officinalis]